MGKGMGRGGEWVAVLSRPRHRPDSSSLSPDVRLHHCLLGPRELRPYTRALRRNDLATKRGELDGKGR